LATNSALTLALKAQDKGVKIAVEVPSDIVIENDGELLGLILQNLLGNAVKYSSMGTVRLRAEMADGHCTLSVRDEGMGIAAEHLQHIFQAFSRGDAHGEPGVGLGLSIAAQAAKLLGGTLSVQSIVGQGSTFSLTIAL
jgi:signal transduction histidine kinase